MAGSPGYAASRRTPGARPRSSQWDEKHGLWKANPLADWKEPEVWTYILEHGVPYNKLHDLAYASIGCTHCTQRGVAREGRWAHTAKVECGLHT